MGRLIKGRADNLSAHSALQVGNFFRSLPNESDQQVGFGMVLGDGVGDRFQQHSFASFGRRDDQAALPATNWSNQVDEATGEIGRPVSMSNRSRGKMGVKASKC